ncbi:hypothetical protein LK07_02170 [Streptomyces pluripotens]|uniref:Uncharacterized protein n=1 Tax=Streptomyces pluripotens TaxID=1355015 RepID=A0A221NSP7_9ACTN|nr:hypothetical protein LK06_001080 [Streptomyces pluripotens]ASN23023.1 hypothetical protein LK07_02170 [Streptomyces pluripotens]
MVRTSRTAPAAPGTHARRTGRNPKCVQYGGFRPARREHAPDVAGTAQDRRNTPEGSAHHGPWVRGKRGPPRGRPL